MKEKHKGHETDERRERNAAAHQALKIHRCSYKISKASLIGILASSLITYFPPWIHTELSLLFQYSKKKPKNCCQEGGQ